MQTWENLYALTGPLGFNTNLPTEMCIHSNCISRAVALDLKVQAKIGIKVRQRTKIRIFAAFRNVRGCADHHQEIFSAIEHFANAASADQVRKATTKPDFTYTAREAKEYGSQVVTALTAWMRMEFTMTAAIHDSVRHLRQVLTEAALGIAAVAPIPQQVLATKGEFEHAR